MWILFNLFLKAFQQSFALQTGIITKKEYIHPFKAMVSDTVLYTGYNVSCVNGFDWCNLFFNTCNANYHLYGPCLWWSIEIIYISHMDEALFVSIRAKEQRNIFFVFLTSRQCAIRNS